jgi:hypothetical protein
LAVQVSAVFTGTFLDFELKLIVKGAPYCPVIFGW